MDDLEVPLLVDVASRLRAALWRAETAEWFGHSADRSVPMVWSGWVDEDAPVTRPGPPPIPPSPPSAPAPPSPRPRWVSSLTSPADGDREGNPVSHFSWSSSKEEEVEDHDQSAPPSPSPPVPSPPSPAEMREPVPPPALRGNFITVSPPTMGRDRAARPARPPRADAACGSRSRSVSPAKARVDASPSAAAAASGGYASPGQRGLQSSGSGHFTTTSGSQPRHQTTVASGYQPVVGDRESPYLDATSGILDMASTTPTSRRVVVRDQPPRAPPLPGRALRPSPSGPALRSSPSGFGLPSSSSGPAFRSSPFGSGLAPSASGPALPSFSSGRALRSSPSGPVLRTPPGPLHTGRLLDLSQRHPAPVVASGYVPNYQVVVQNQGESAAAAPRQSQYPTWHSGAGQSRVQQLAVPETSRPASSIYSQDDEQDQELLARRFPSSISPLLANRTSVNEPGGRLHEEYFAATASMSPTLGTSPYLSSDIESSPFRFSMLDAYFHDDAPSAAPTPAITDDYCPALDIIGGVDPDSGDESGSPPSTPRAGNGSPNNPFQTPRAAAAMGTVSSSSTHNSPETTPRAAATTGTPLRQVQEEADTGSHVQEQEETDSEPRTLTPSEHLLPDITHYRQATKTMIGEGGWLEDTSGNRRPARDPLRKKNFFERLSKKCKNLIEGTPRSSLNLGASSFKPDPNLPSSLAINISPPAQAVLYAEHEWAITWALNDYLTAQHNRGRIDFSKIDQIITTWKKRSRPKPNGFWFDAETQLDIVLHHIGLFRFYGPLASAKQIKATVQAMMRHCRDMRIKTYCSPDLVLRKRLGDTAVLFEMLGTEEKIGRVLTRVQGLYQTFLEEGLAREEKERQMQAQQQIQAQQKLIQQQQQMQAQLQMQQQQQIQQRELEIIGRPRSSDQSPQASTLSSGGRGQRSSGRVQSGLRRVASHGEALREQPGTPTAPHGHGFF
ncbi:hypothetical protein QBC35DRAFT_464978 [Podospora australis]|uniref:Uncharacterized protein n=1 Tax=Podospora australis TaxID=1536484 RepID=A0AAN6WQC2_9PEZI|nr:hypothetical protein QBC35DRAFT_464978 [Podospora australis]